MAIPDWAVVLMSVILGGAISMAAQYLPQRWTADRSRRQQSFATLTGLVSTYPSLYKMRMEAAALETYYGELLKRERDPPSSQALRQFERYTEISKEWMVELLRMKREIFEALGSAAAVFGPIDGLRESMDKAAGFQTPKVVGPSGPAANLEEWRFNAYKTWSDAVDAQLVPVLNRVLDLLRPKL